MSGPKATASTTEATERASVSSSRVIGVGPDSPASASTHTLSTAISDHLQLLEEGDDALGAVPLVHHDLAGGAGLGLGDVGDLLARAGRADLEGSSPRSATVRLSTGLDLAAMIPLKEG